MAAQMLDEQLSRDIDHTLAIINAKINSITPPMSTNDKGTPNKSRAPRMMPQFPLAPPQLPMLDFQYDFKSRRKC